MDSEYITFKTLSFLLNDLNNFVQLNLTRSTFSKYSYLGSVDLENFKPLCSSSSHLSKSESSDQDVLDNELIEEVETYANAA